MSNRLGRGLEALISTGKESTDRNTGITTVKIETIKPNPYQPRTTFDQEKLNELADSLAESGMIQPIIVTKNANSEYELIAGERRLEAAKIAGFNELPVIIRCVSPREQLQFALIENIQRENLNPIEEAKAYLQLQEQFELTHQDIAKFMGKDRVTVTNTVRLLKLNQQVQDYIETGKISSGHGRALLQLSDENQVIYAELIIKKSYSVREAERKIKKMLLNEDTKPEPDKKDPERLEYLKIVQEKLNRKLALPIKLEESKRGGTVSIRYKNDDELQNLLKQLLTEQ